LYKAGVRLVLGGVALGLDSKFFPDPRKLAKRIGLPDDAIQFLGWVREEDKALLYASAQLFLFPSLYEGFGLPPLEAMACGTPVISSNAASLPEIVGDAALLVEPEAAIGWAETIRVAMKNEGRRAEMRARGLAQAKKFSWERAARETLQVYESIKL
jgi:glycosyltransferase involved in cell wall biosynthesis